jgi:hypothetical protein
MNRILCLLSALSLLCLLHLSASAEGPDTNRPHPPAMKDGRAKLPPWLNDPGHTPRDHPHLQKWMKQMQEKNPEEFERLQTLRQEDPEAFSDELQSRVQKKGQTSRDKFKGPRMNGKVRSEKLKELEKKNRSLAKQAMTAEGEEREPAISELRQSLGDAFDEREAIRMKHLEQARKELDRHQEMSAQRQQNRDRIINEQLDWILQHKKPQGPLPSKN